MTRSRLVFDRLSHFLASAIDTIIPLNEKVTQSIKYLTDLTRQPAHFPG